MSNIAEYTYFIEIIAISLVSLALIAIVAAIFFRQWSGKAEHKKILSLRNSMQYEKDKIDITISEIVAIEQETHNNLAATKSQMQTMSEQQKAISDKSKEIELRAEHIALLEKEVQQTTKILSERIDSIEKSWDQKLESTVNTVEQLSSILEENLKHIKNQNIIANNLTQSLTTQYDDLQLEKKQSAIHHSIETTLKASTQLNTQLEHLQQKAESAFAQFSEKLESFDTFDKLDKKTDKKPFHLNKAHITFDDIDAIALSIEESDPTKQDTPPQLESVTVENLTKPAELKDYADKKFFAKNKKRLVK